jgi:hypothetical protein
MQFDGNLCELIVRISKSVLLQSVLVVENKATRMNHILLCLMTSEITPSYGVAFTGITRLRTPAARSNWALQINALTEREELLV